MKNWLKKNLLTISGLMVGAIAGFLYWKFIGCNSGTCAITSNPRNSTIYFAVMGALLFNIFQKQKAKDAG